MRPVIPFVLSFPFMLLVAMSCGSSDDGPTSPAGGGGSEEGAAGSRASTGAAGTDLTEANEGSAGTAQEGTGGTVQAGSDGTSGAAGAGGAVAGGSAGNSGTGGSAGSPACPSGKGPAMVRVPGPGGTSYCIDTTEVTQAQYVAFANAKGDDTSGQRPECSWNTRYLPLPSYTDAGGEPHGECPLTTVDPKNPSAALPMVCVDWCDAAAFCSWAGKRLCGSIGGGQSTSVKDPKDQWYNACSQQGAAAYPYGDRYQPATCVDDAYEKAAVTAKKKSISSAEPVATAAPLCHAMGAPFDALFDMSGNVAEWEDLKFAGNNNWYASRGGDYTATDSDPNASIPALRCDAEAYGAPTGLGANIGLRCCAD